MENGIYVIDARRALEVKDGLAAGLSLGSHHVRGTAGTLEDRAVWVRHDKPAQPVSEKLAALLANAQTSALSVMSMAEFDAARAAAC